MKEVNTMANEDERRLHAEQLARDLELKEPVRYIPFRYGDVDLLIPRGADDPTPDNVIKVGGVELQISGE